MAYRIRTASADDAGALLAVYAPYVTQSCISFETEPPSLEEYRRRVADIAARFPYLVLEQDGNVVGYAYAHEFSERPAYCWSVETSIYLSPGCTGAGVGGILLGALEELLARAGFTNAEACITDDNRASIAFHEKHGYRLRAAFPQCAYKHGRWLGIVWMEKYVAEHAENPAAPRALSAAEAEPVLERANALLADAREKR